jgi:AraC family transcriptional regulator of arabinose operon
METSAARLEKKTVRRVCSTDEYIRHAVSFIEMNYASITVNDVVEYIGFTRSYFTTIFKKKTGISPQDYLMQYRLKNASRLLLETDLPVHVIAEKVGYDDPLYFSKLFRKTYRVSPRAYREKG